MSLQSNETVVRVLYKDTDKMGVVYYANYLVWFEIGRTEYFRELGLPYVEFEKHDILMPVINVSCNYKLPAYYDDQIKIITSLQSLQGTRISFYYQIKRDTYLLAYGNTEHAFINHKGKPLALNKFNPEIWERLQGVSTISSELN